MANLKNFVLVIWVIILITSSITLLKSINDGNLHDVKILLAFVVLSLFTIYSFVKIY